MTTQSATTYSYTPIFGTKFNNWLKAILIRDGFYPEDLSVVSGSAVLEHVWFNLQKRAVGDVLHEVRMMWHQALAMEEGIELGQAIAKVEELITTRNAFFNSGRGLVTGNPAERAAEEVKSTELIEAPELSAEEVKAARKLKKMAAKSDVVKQVLFYILQEYPTWETGFCNTAGIHTATMRATINAISKAAKCPRHRTLKDHLFKILRARKVTL